MKTVLQALYETYLRTGQPRPSVDDSIDWRTAIGLFQQFPKQATIALYEIVRANPPPEEMRTNRLLGTNPFLYQLHKMTESEQTCANTNIMVSVITRPKENDIVKVWNRTYTTLPLSKWDWKENEPHLFDIPLLYTSLLEFCRAC